MRIFIIKKMIRWQQILLLVCALLHSVYLTAAPIMLKNLDYKNPRLKQLRKEIFHNLRYSKDRNFRRRHTIIPLKFYSYTVRNREKFFLIMARTGTDLESLASVNSLSSPHHIYQGMKLLIPNMRGSYYTGKKSKNLKELAALLRIPEKAIQKDKKTKKLFIAGKALGKKEKSYFYGVAFAHPLPGGRVSSRYGMRKDPFSRKKTFHGGLDVAAKKGSPVYASAGGKVVFASKKGGYGKLIILKHELGYETRYGHLNKILVKRGKKIKKGQKIGEVGETGRATGPHLHFEIRRYKKRRKPIFTKHR